MKAQRLWSPYPTRQQLFLLQACLLEADKAIASWRAWQNEVKIEDLDIGSQRLVPLLYDRLSSLGVADSALERYRGLSRYFWCQSQARGRILEGILLSFKQAAIPVLVLKGVVLALLYYKKWGLRPANDIDLLVPPSYAEPAGELLSRGGWTSNQVHLLGSACFRTAGASIVLRDQKGNELDLHWHLMHENCAESADENYWNRSQEILIHSSETKTLSDTDQLFHVLAHSTGPDSVAPIRWLADAVMILRTSDIRWDQFLATVIEQRMVRRVCPALTYLHREFAISVPDHVLKALRRAPQSALEIIEGYMENEHLPRLIRTVGLRYAQYRRNAFAPDSPRSFLSYMQIVWGASSRTGAAKQILQRLLLYLRAS